MSRNTENALLEGPCRVLATSRHLMTRERSGLVKKVKRVGHGFRNFNNYRLRLLLHCGVEWHTRPVSNQDAAHHDWSRRARLMASRAYHARKNVVGVEPSDVEDLSGCDRLSDEHRVEKIVQPMAGTRRAVCRRLLERHCLLCSRLRIDATKAEPLVPPRLAEVFDGPKQDGAGSKRIAL